MKFVSFAVALPALVCAAAAPVFADDPVAARPPIVVQDVVFSGNGNIAGLGDVEVRFENEAATPVTRVQFDVTKGAGGTMRLDDVGSFAPHAVIVHDFRVSSLGDEDALVVREVQFSDGTVWEAPAAAAPASRRQATEGGNEQTSR